jgi:flagellar capping protein FliD
MNGSANAVSSMNTTSTSSKRLSGLVSGLDTDNLVKQLTIGTQKKIDKQMQNKQIATWKQSAYREVINALSEFKGKYLSSASNSNSISNPSFFKSSGIKNVSPFLNVSGNSDVAKKMVITQISQLAKQASFSSSHKVSNQQIKTGEIKDNFNNCKVLANSLTITYGGKDYDIKLSEDINVDGSDTDAAKAIIDDLNTQINGIDDLKGKVSISGSDGAYKLKTGSDIKVKSGSDNLLAGLGLEKDKTYTKDTDLTLNKDKLYSSSNLGDTLSGSTLTFNLNGLKKNIKFDESEKDKYDTTSDLENYLQTKLDSAYGSGKVEVKLDTTDDGNGYLSFKTIDNNSTISIESCDKYGILGKSGALHTYAGESNRINLHKTLDDIKENLSSELTAGPEGKYSIKVNDKEFTFEGTDNLENVINTINNDAEANVNILYSSVTDTFSVTAKNGGSGSRVDIEDVGGNLSKVMFGEETEKKVQDGQDAKMKVSFDGNKDHTVDIVRSENQFTLDGVNFELLEEMDSISTPKDSPITFDADNKSDEIFDKVKKFVDDYNAIMDNVNGRVTEQKEADGPYLPLTDAQREEMNETQIKNWEAKAKKGLLRSDTTLYALHSDLHHAMTDNLKDSQDALYQIGISTKPYDFTYSGKLEIDEEKLKKALNDDPDKVASLFTGENGIATRLNEVIDNNIKTTGEMKGRLVQKAGSDISIGVDNSYFTRSIKGYTDKIAELKDKMETQQEYYYAKFTRLETYLSKMNAQAGLFTQGTEGM